MADSLCGPSNALQNFQKHSTADRTLQQDRLISRKSPSQGFRSSPSTNAGQLDAELEAFQNGHLSFDPHGFQPHTFSPVPQNLIQPGPAAWAADFQRMNLSSPPSRFQQQPLHSNPGQQSSDIAAWHQDFVQELHSMDTLSTNQVGGSFNRFSPMSAMNMGPQFGIGFNEGHADMTIAQQKQTVEKYDEEAFARAFEEASKSEIISEQDGGQLRVSELGQDILVNESAERLLSDESRIDQAPKIGSDLIHNPADQDPQDQDEQTDPDALARTAAHLLDTLKSNTTSKFQNSQFLGLMRQLRDKEAWVEGDKIVGVNGVEEGIPATVSAEITEAKVLEQ